MLYLARRRMPALFGGAAAVTPWYLSGGINAANCIIAYQPKGAASLAASYVNLVNPGTYDAAPGTAPTFAAATGWAFASTSSQFLKTGYTGSLRKHTIIVRFSDCAVGGDKYILGQGVTSTSGKFTLSPNNAFYAGLRALIEDGVSGTNGIVTVSPAKITSGVVAIVSGAAANYVYVDGTDTSATFSISGTASTQEIIIGALIESYGFADVKIQAFVHYNKELNATEVAAVSSAMAAL